MSGFTPLALSALAISVISSLTYVGYFQLRAVSVPRTFSKTLATAGLAVASAVQGLPLVFTMAMALAAGADYLKSFRDDHRLNLAIGVSATMHILLCIWFGVYLWVGIKAPLAGILGFTGIAGGFFALVWPRLRPSLFMLLPYFLCCLAVFYLGLGATPGRPLLAVGLISYLLSLMLLGVELVLFHGQYRYLRIVGPIIWMLYYCGLLAMMAGAVT